MRHGKKVNHLSRTSSHRKAMLSNMASSLILHKRIKTTTAKAKALKVYVEPLITKSKNDTTASRRLVFSYLRNKYAVTELFREVSQKVMDRPGGYTRIIKLPNRLGDNAQMCIIELVDYNTLLLDAKKDEKKTTRRSRRGGSKTGAAKVEETVKTEKVEEPIVEETIGEMTDVDVQVEETATEEPKVEEVASEETPAETEAEETPAVDETKKEETVAETPAEEPKAEEAPVVENAPVEEPKAEDTPAEEKPTE